MRFREVILYMKNNLKNELLIKEIYKKYQIRYNVQLPEIHNIVFLDKSNSWASFSQKNLFNKCYILYVDAQLFSQDIRFIKQVLFHEFTHMVDSLNFLDRKFEEFSHIMISYSEFHASQREMIERIEQTCQDIIDLQSIVYYTSEEPLYLLMSHSFQVMKISLSKMETNNGKEDFYYNPRSVYYFYGYVSALKFYGIDYIITVSQIPQYIVAQILKIQLLLSEEKPNIDNILQSYLEFERMIIIKSIQNEKNKKSDKM